MRIIRLIEYDFYERDELDEQMGRSMPDGLRFVGLVGTIMVTTLQDDRRIVNVFPGVELKEND